MRRLSLILLTILAIPLARSTPAMAGEIVDGVVATVDKTPILLSEWQESVCFEAFMQQKPLTHVSTTDRLLALQRLIDRRLLQLQMKGERALKASTKDTREQAGKVRQQVAAGQDDAHWNAFLGAYGLDQRELEDQLAQQVEVMNFIEVRLRPSVHIAPEEVEAYYQNILLPDLRSNGQHSVALVDVAAKIRELLTQQQMDEMLEAWLHNLRQQARVESTVPLPRAEPGGRQGGK